MRASGLLDICIPTYNRCKELTRLIKFFDTELSNVELTRLVRIIISDNASDDTVQCSIQSLLEKDITHKENFIYLRNDHNIGIVANAYKVIEYTSSRYIWVMGDDDILEEGVLSQVLKIGKQYDPNFIFLNHDLLIGKKKSSILCCDIEAGWHEDSWGMIRKHLHLNTDALGLTSAVIFKRFILKRITKCLPLDGRYDYGWSYLAGIYAAALGKGYFEGRIFLHKQSYGCSWMSEYYHAVYGSFCSLQKLKVLGCKRIIIKELQRSYIEETGILYDIIEQILINNDREICIKFLLKLLRCDVKAVLLRVKDL